MTVTLGRPRRGVSTVVKAGKAGLVGLRTFFWLLMVWIGCVGLAQAATVLQVSAGASHTVAVMSDGTLWTWGLNSSGQLGNGSLINASSPVQIGTGFAKVSAGSGHTVAVKTDGTLWAWGLNSSGQLGNGSLTNASIPVQIGTGFAQAAAGRNHTVAVKPDGALWAWGDNTLGQLGNATTTSTNSPVQIGAGFAQVAAVSDYTVAVKSDNTLWAWGDNALGQLGNGTTTRANSPVQIGTGFTSVAAGDGHAFAIKSDRTLWAWGFNGFGQFSNGTTTSSNSPVQVGTGFSFAQVSAGTSHSASITSDGKLWTSGFNGFGQLGNGTTTSESSAILIGTGFSQVSAGSFHTVAIKSDGTMWAWGRNVTGQLGNGTTINATIPIAIALSSQPPAVVSLSVSGPSTLQSSATAKLVASAGYLGGATKLINPAWTSSNPAVATVSALGVLAVGSVTTDTPVTITATYAENGITVTSSLIVKVTAAPATLSSLAIVGKASVPAGAQILLVASATYSDGSTRAVGATTWMVTPTNLGTVDSRGRFTAGAVSVDSDATITASYTEGVITRSTAQVVRISVAPLVLQSLTIIGARGTLASGETLALVAEGIYADGSRKVAATTTWQVDGNAATISSTGVLTAKPVSVDTPSVVSASYTEAGVSTRAQYLIVIQAQATPTQVLAEVESTGPRENAGLALWTRWSPLTGGVPLRGPSVQLTYNMYIVALVPGGALVASPTFFLLNRSNQWQAQGSPLAEYLSGVAEGSFQLITLFENLNSNILSGTQFYVGYGISDQEMLEQRRYRLVYQMQ